MTEENMTLQADEIEAISAIYGEDFKVEDEFLRQYSIKVAYEDLSVLLRISLPDEYPLEYPPKYEIDGHWLRGSRRKQLQAHLDEIYVENIGESILYLWVEKVREFLQDLNEVENTTEEILKLNLTSSTSQEENSPSKSISCPEISSGELIVDRKSVFQPHLARVTSTEEVVLVLNKLKENRKIATATHNMYAYRISLKSGTVAQDCEDDGETKAGSRMLHLMAVLDVLDVLVVVTRWYGGIQLGPDRFKHINTATREILNKCGFLDSADKKEKRPKKSK